MKQIICTGLLLLFSFFGYSQSIKVSVDGIENNKGNIEIGLYNSSEGFTEYEKRFKGTSIKSSQNGITYTFQDIPEGTYAIAIFHDENMDKMINKTWLGIPKENYGFSLNKFGSFGPPDFKEVSFYIAKGEVKTMKIILD